MPRKIELRVLRPVSAGGRPNRNLPSLSGGRVLPALVGVICGPAATLLRALQSRPCGGASPVHSSGCSVFLAPDGDQVAVEHILDVARIEQVKGDLSGAAAKLDRSGPRALQPAALQPAMPFAGRDRQDVLDLTRDDRQVLDVAHGFGQDGCCRFNIGIRVIGQAQSEHPGFDVKQLSKGRRKARANFEENAPCPHRRSQSRRRR